MQAMQASSFPVSSASSEAVKKLRPPEGPTRAGSPAAGGQFRPGLARQNTTVVATSAFAEHEKINGSIVLIILNNLVEQA